MGFTGNIARDYSVVGGLLERLELPASLSSPLLAHARAVERQADRLGLVSRGDADSIVSRHTADSLLFALVRRPGRDERWVDVGSGAGFPGIVLAASFPQTTFLLSEPQRRRAGFLESIASELGLANVDISMTRAEELQDRFDVAVARALTGPDEALTRLIRLVKPAGAAIVALGADAPNPVGAEFVRLADLGDVDSPGVFSMMTREG